MKKKYLVFPGEVISKADGQTHYITAGQLVRLYKVNPLEVKTILSDKDLLGIRREDYIELHPRFDGNYKHYGR